MFSPQFGDNPPVLDTVKVSVSGVPCQTPLRPTWHFAPSRAASSLRPCALSHPRAGARYPAHVCFIPLVTFPTLHLSPRPLLGLLGGPSGSKAQVAVRDSRILSYFCNQRAPGGPSGRAHATCVLYGDRFCSVFPYTVSCSSSS